MNQRRLSRRSLLRASLLAAGAVATPFLARNGNGEIGHVVRTDGSTSPQPVVLQQADSGRTL